MAVRRPVFEEVGGFDQSFLAFEDVDLFWRLQLRGYALGPAEGAVVARRERSGFAATLRQRFGYGRFGPALYVRFRSSGMERDLSAALKAWAWLVLTSPLLVRPGRRTWWAQIAGLRAGRLVGSIERRVLFL